MAEKKYAVAIVNLSSTIKENEAGIFDEIKKSLNICEDQPIAIIPEEKPYSISSIKKKLDGLTLSKDEIFEIITDIVDNRLMRSEIASFVTAVYAKGMNIDEVEHMTRAIAETGQMLHFNVKPITDIHSIGGVPGNRTTLLVVPIIAAAGLYIPKTASRAITDPAGTADTMEVLAPVEHSIEEIKEIVLEHKGCIVWGGAIDMAPADDLIVEVERPLQLDPTAMLLSSIMAKKYAAGATDVLIEIPHGFGTKCTRQRANELEKKFLTLGSRLGIKLKVVKTDGSQPIGRGIGPALEARDILWILEKSHLAPNDLKNRACYLAGQILELIKKVRSGAGFKFAANLIENKIAFKKMKEIIAAQGGEPDITSEHISIGKYDETVFAEKSGTVQVINNDAIKRLCRHLGAPYNKGAGVYLWAKVGDKVKEGDKLFSLYAESGRKLAEGLEFVEINNPYKIKG
jgi:AMP phosphorylase